MARKTRTRSGTNALVAAAKRVPLDDPARARKIIGRRRPWQADSWLYFDEVPEIKHGVWWLGNNISKLRLVASVLVSDDPEADPIPIGDEKAAVSPKLAAAAQAELERLVSSVGGQPEILRALEMNLEVGGECSIVGFGEHEGQVKDRDGTFRSVTFPEEWDIKSVDEVEVKDDATYVMNDDGERTALDDERDTIMRVWQRHPKKSQEADCAMRGVLGECEALLLLGNQVKAEARSHQGAGIITMPNELSFGTVEPTDTEEGEDGRRDPFAETLMDALEDANEGVGNPAEVMPLVLRGPAEYLTPDYVRLISLARDSGEYLERRIDARVTRLARGMNLPVEVTMGHQGTTFANAEQVDRDTFDDYLEPRAVMICDALTVAYLRPNLIDAGFDPEEVDDIVVWYDASRLVKKVDLQANADEGLSTGAISTATWRRVKGFTEEDAPKVEEALLNSALRRAGIDANTFREILRLFNVDLPDPPADTPAAAQARAILSALPPDAMATLVEGLLAAHDPPNARGRPHERPALAAAAGRGPNPGRQLMDIDREVRTRILIAADDAMTRALERAGNRIKGKSARLRTLVRSVPSLYVATTVGPTLVAEAGLGDPELLAGAWDELDGQFHSWGASAQAEALDVASKLGGFSAAQRAKLGLRQAADLDEAWAWARESLDSLAAAKLYHPDLLAPNLGEFDPTLRVPTGLVRQSVAIAGGAAHLTTTSTKDPTAWIAVSTDGTPAGGIGTGEQLTLALQDHGVTVEAYKWVYGAAFRGSPFDGHLVLDGLYFDRFDDPSLTVSPGDSWLPYSHYFPGDHTGCVCDVEPVLVEQSRLGKHGPSTSLEAEEIQGPDFYQPELTNADSQIVEHAPDGSVLTDKHGHDILTEAQQQKLALEKSQKAIDEEILAQERKNAAAIKKHNEDLLFIKDVEDVPKKPKVTITDVGPKPTIEDNLKKNHPAGDPDSWQGKDLEEAEFEADLEADEAFDPGIFKQLPRPTIDEQLGAITPEQHRVLIDDPFTDELYDALHPDYTPAQYRKMAQLSGDDKYLAQRKLLSNAFKRTPYELTVDNGRGLYKVSNPTHDARRIIESYQGGSTRWVRDLIGQASKGGGTLTSVQIDGAKAWLGALRNVPNNLAPAKLWRGMGLKGGVAQYKALYAVGEPVDLLPSGFTSAERVAERFGTEKAGQYARDRGGSTKVVFEWVGAGKKAIPTENIGFFNEHEWVTAGRWEVTKLVESTEDIYGKQIPVLHVTMKQTATL
jgi:hypothetical protein